MTRLRGPIDELDHVQGVAGAELTLVEYGDYQCPYCGQAYAIVKRVQRRLGPRLRFAFRNFPLTAAHPLALIAAETAEAAGAQGKFWEMHDRLYQRQAQLGMRLFLELAGELMLDRARFVDDIEQGAYRQRVRDDFVGGVRSGVNGTPCFFIGDERHDGAWDEDALIDALENATQRDATTIMHP